MTFLNKVKNHIYELLLSFSIKRRDVSLFEKYFNKLSTERQSALFHKNVAIFVDNESDIFVHSFIDMGFFKKLPKEKLRNYIDRYFYRGNWTLYQKLMSFIDDAKAYEYHLTYSIDNNKQNSMANLLRLGVRLNPERFYMGLSAAIKKEDIERIERYVEAGADINNNNKLSTKVANSLIYAASLKKYRLMSYLFREGAVDDGRCQSIAHPVNKAIKENDLEWLVEMKKNHIYLPKTLESKNISNEAANIIATWDLDTLKDVTDFSSIEKKDKSRL